MSIFGAVLKNSAFLRSKTLVKVAETCAVSLRQVHKDKRAFVDVPKPGKGTAYRRIVNYPEEYTVAPLTVRNLGGRHPVTGRQVVRTIGGGIKHKYHWIKWPRDGPAQGPPQEEKVLQILKCGCRTAHVALVAVRNELKYILATENMKAGDIIKTSKFIPRNPVKPNEGDAYPVGALPVGTLVHNIQIHPTVETTIVHSAGSSAIIKRVVDEKVIIQLPSKFERVFEQQCMATVGRLSNPEHSSIPIGSPQRLRELGYRPRSGLWQRKTGRFGRKIKKLKLQTFSPKKEDPETIRCTLPYIKI